MTDTTIAQRYRLSHLEGFLASGLSMRAYCRLPGSPSRKTLAKHLARFREGGPGALVGRRPSRRPHNRTSPLDEAAILAHAQAHSGDGPQRIALELKGRISVGHCGVHGVLRRHGINIRAAREDWARRRLGVVATPGEVARARQAAKHRHIEVLYPGQLWGQDTFLIGKLKGVGTVYHHLAVDLASSYAVARVYEGRSAANACDFLQNHWRHKAKNLGIHTALQDNGTEFTAARWRGPDGRSSHDFERLAEGLGIGLRFIRPAHPWTNGACERLHQTLLHEFYIPALSSKIYTSAQELDYDLQLFLGWYNFQRTHQGRRLRGLRPADVYFSGATPKEGFRFHVA